PGGEVVKNDTDHLQTVLDAIERNKLCRHSFLAGIGGGAVLDMVGYAATIAHRGVRHIRIPTTVLAQNDSGVGVKNGINAFGKKNFLGTFSPPYAVINDTLFLKTLSDRDWRSGISEAVKVALIKDKNFFSNILSNAEALVERDMAAMEALIFRCAELHMNHIAQGDPFERGSSRPLDFGHWSAHKLEQLTSNRIKHGEAVAIGIALDATISFLSERLNLVEWKAILSLLSGLGFELYDEELGKVMNDENPILKGLEEFREHLGGKLTIMLLEKIGKGVEVNEIDKKQVLDSIIILKNFQKHLEDEAGDESSFFLLSKAS
ncbi:MAG: 3-dehydroquinate synthase, partial [Cytophagaceae bacterium]|nr:3-dehydroquinate synthase [Cytophagaceae bacterium]